MGGRKKSRERLADLRAQQRAIELKMKKKQRGDGHWGAPTEEGELENGNGGGSRCRMMVIRGDGEGRRVEMVCFGWKAEAGEDGCLVMQLRKRKGQAVKTGVVIPNSADVVCCEEGLKRMRVSQD